MEVHTEAEGLFEASKREQGTIAFPYADLDTAVEVAKAVYSRAGFGECELDELASELDMTMSGGFRLKTATARVFGFIEKAARSSFRLTELGRRISSEIGGAAAMVDAFLHVPLYHRLYERYRGQKLPPPKAVEKEMIALGVPLKQAERARQVFERSALQAGFNQDGAERLVKPRVSDIPIEAPSGSAKAEAFLGVQSAGRPEVVPERLMKQNSSASGSPFIEGLVDQLPAPGENWEAKDRAKWLRAAISVFDLVYAAETPRSIVVTIQKADDDDH